jgi:hypothetical protein
MVFMTSMTFMAVGEVPEEGRKLHFCPAGITRRLEGLVRTEHGGYSMKQLVNWK